MFRVVLQHHQLQKQVQTVQVSCHLHSPLWLWNIDPACWLWEKDPSLRNKRLWKLLCIFYLEHKINNWVLWKINSLFWVHRNLFWQKSRYRNLHGSGTSHATTASPKPSFRTPWRVGDNVVSRGNAGCCIISVYVIAYRCASFIMLYIKAPGSFVFLYVFIVYICASCMLSCPSNPYTVHTILKIQFLTSFFFFFFVKHSISISCICDFDSHEKWESYV